MKIRTTAYKAKDNSVHLKEEDQVKRDIEILTVEINVIYDGIAEHLSDEAPMSDDWRAKAISGADEFKAMLLSLFDNHILKVREIFRLQTKLDTLQRRFDKLTAATRDPDPRVGDDCDDEQEEDDDEDDIRESRERQSKSAPASKTKGKQ